MKEGQNSHNPKQAKPSFMRSAAAVWLVELLLLVTLGIAVYNDWDAPLRNKIFSIDVYGFEMVPRLRQHYIAQMKLSYFLVYALITILVASLVAAYRNRRELRERFASLTDRNTSICAKDFLELRNGLIASRMLDGSEFTGVYILHNETKEKYYVGQSVRVLSRITQHLTGHGNGDVYADYKNGDEFTVQTISLISSGYLSLNDLERDAIRAYDAFDNGYNRTRGNRR